MVSSEKLEFARSAGKQAETVSPFAQSTMVMGPAGEMREEFQLPARRDASLPKGADDTNGCALLNGDFRNLQRVNRTMVVAFSFETVCAGIATICGSL